MYSTCLFCQQSLGRNGVLEAFPVGRRLAYDAAKGRLWVVCRSCERWNLTPLDARWEAIEEAERAFRGTRQRASSDQIGLARLNEGLELVRVGAPLRPEMAAWRYGDQFGRRRRRHMAGLGAVALGGTAVLVAGPITGLLGVGLLSPMFSLVNLAYVAHRGRNPIAVYTSDDADPLLIPPDLLRNVAMRADGDGIRLSVDGVRKRPGRFGVFNSRAIRRHQLHGVEAMRAASQLLPRFNRLGGSVRTVSDAVGLLDASRSAEAYFARIADAERSRFFARSWQWGEPGALHALPPAVRLALEMASHEDAERRALDGELAALERAWQQAEELASIADDLALPSGVRSAFERLKREPR